MDLLRLGELELDALREVANIGAGHAATALSHLAGHRITVAVPEVLVIPLEEVGGLVGDPGMVVAAVIARIEGAVTGRTLQVVPGATAARLTALLLGKRERRFPEDFGPLEQSALGRIGETLVGAYLNALTELTRLPLRASAPAVAVDMCAAILTTSYVNFGSDEDHVVCVNTRLGIDTSAELPAHFLLIPDQPLLTAILRSLGIA